MLKGVEKVAFFLQGRGRSRGGIEAFCDLCGWVFGCDFNEGGSHEEMRLGEECVAEWRGGRFSV